MLAVNLFGGPGSGKSTLAAMIFAELKQSGSGLVSELVPEFAKELVWEQRRAALASRTFVLGTQVFWMARLGGKADIAATDSPVLLNRVYGEREGMPQCFLDLCVCEHRIFPSLNFLIRRPAGYEQAGRRETEAQAHEVDSAVAELLRETGVGYVPCRPVAEDAARIARAAECVALSLRAA